MQCSSFVSFPYFLVVFVLYGDLLHFRYNHWGRASPWFGGNNPRDDIMPVNGDDGFYPTTGNELVGSSLCFILLLFEKIVALN